MEQFTPLFPNSLSHFKFAQYVQNMWFIIQDHYPTTHFLNIYGIFLIDGLHVHTICTKIYRVNTIIGVVQISPLKDLYRKK